MTSSLATALPAPARTLPALRDYAVTMVVTNTTRWALRLDGSHVSRGLWESPLPRVLEPGSVHSFTAVGAAGLRAFASYTAGPVGQDHVLLAAQHVGDTAGTRATGPGGRPSERVAVSACTLHRGADLAADYVVGETGGGQGPAGRWWAWFSRGR